MTQHKISPCLSLDLSGEIALNLLEKKLYSWKKVIYKTTFVIFYHLIYFSAEWVFVLDISKVGIVSNKKDSKKNVLPQV